MCRCMYVCVFVHTWTIHNTYIHTYIHTYVHTYVHTYKVYLFNQFHNTYLQLFPCRPKVSTNSLLLKRAMEGVHPSASSALAERRKTVKTPPEAESERVEEDKEDLRTVIASHRSSKQKSERKRDVRDRHVVMEEQDVLPAKRVKQALLFEEEGEIEHRVEAASTSKEKPVKR